MTELHTIATPQLWAITLISVVLLLAVDFIITRKPHEVSMKEAVGWSIFYIALPLLFGVWVWNAHGSDIGVKYYTGYLVEKSLSVDNLFVFIVIIGSFAVPRALQQRVLLVGVIGALILRSIFIVLGATLIEKFAATFLLFGVILLATAVKVFRDARSDEDTQVDPNEMAVVRFIRRFWPVTGEYHGTRVTWKEMGRRALTPLGLVMATIIGTDIVFAIDSIPAVYGIKSDPYLVFVTNATTGVRPPRADDFTLPIVSKPRCGRVPTSTNTACADHSSRTDKTSSTGTACRVSKPTASSMETSDSWPSPTSLATKTRKTTCPDRIPTTRRADPASADTAASFSSRRTTT